MKSIMDYVNEVKEASITKDTEGKVKQNRNFNKSQFDDVMVTLLNDTEYEATVVTKRNDDGTVVTKQVNPAMAFREGTLKPILAGFGVDKIEAENIKTVEITKVDGLYEIMSEGIELYARTGKKFNFLPKEDLSASLTLDEIEEEVKTYRVPNSDETTTVKEGKHTKMKVKSSVPANRKTKIK